MIVIYTMNFKRERERERAKERVHKCVTNKKTHLPEGKMN